MLNLCDARLCFALTSAIARTLRFINIRLFVFRVFSRDTMARLRITKRRAFVRHKLLFPRAVIATGLMR